MSLAAPHHMDEHSFFSDAAIEADAQSITFITFDLGQQGFAADVTFVREILDMMPISPLPNAPAEIIGMVDLRGAGIAVIDLSDRLQLPASQGSASQKIVVVEIPESDGEARPIGIIADRVRSVIELPITDLEPVPKTTTRWDSQAMTGVIRMDGQLVYVLSFATLLSRPMN